MKDTEFVQISTRVRASLGAVSHGERIKKAVDSSASLGALCSAIRSMMIEDAQTAEDAGLDALCDAYFGAAVNLVRALSPAGGIYDSLFYKYDGANLKLVLKASLRNMAPPELFPYGNVDTKKIVEAVEKRDFSNLPAGLGEGARRALEEYSSTGDAISVDLQIDRGCFEDIKKSADESGVPLLKRIAAFDADGANVGAFMRIASMDLPAEAKRSLFVRAYVTGGEIGLEKFPRTDITFAALRDSLSGSEFSSILHKMDESDATPAALEDAIQKKRTDIRDGVRFLSFGADVPAAYILEREAEIRAFSTVGAYISRNASPSEIAEALL